MIIIHAHAFLNSTCSLGTASHRGKVPLVKLHDLQHRQDKPFGVVVMHQQQHELPIWKRVAAGQPRHIRGHGPYAAHTLANSCHEVEAIPIVCAQSASTTCSLPPLRGRVVPPCHGQAASFTGLQVLHVTHFLGELLRDALESPIDLGGKGHLPT